METQLPDTSWIEKPLEHYKNTGQFSLSPVENPLGLDVDDNEYALYERKQNVQTQLSQFGIIQDAFNTLHYEHTKLRGMYLDACAQQRAMYDAWRAGTANQVFPSLNVLECQKSEMRALENSRFAKHSTKAEEIWENFYEQENAAEAQADLDKMLAYVQAKQQKDAANNPNKYPYKH